MPSRKTKAERLARQKQKEEGEFARFTEAPMHILLKRLADVSHPFAYENPVEISHREATVLYEHMRRLECRYRVLYRLIDTHRELSGTLGLIEGAIGCADMFNPDLSQNWGSFK